MHGQMYLKGMKEGIPVALGYFFVSITIGIAARLADLTPMQAAVMSLTNLTSAGQFASFTLIASGASFVEMAISQAVINLRYCLMSCALSQKIDHKLPMGHRLCMAFGITDEIFGLCISQKGKLEPWYMYGVMSVAIPGWVAGTVLGILSTGVLPQPLLNAMSMALYGMFIAVFVPAARDNRILVPIIGIAMAASAAFQLLPMFDFISSGMKIIILTLVLHGSGIIIPDPGGRVMKNYMYILVMAVTTYLIRVVPITLMRKEIQNRTFRSFLTYVPYVTLAVMTFPAILSITDSPWISWVGFLVAMVLAYCRSSLFVVSLGSCILVFVLQLL